MISAISTNLINFRINSPYVKDGQNAPAVTFKGDSTNLIQQYLDAQAAINAPAVVPTQNTANPNYKNNLRTLFTTNSAKILAILPRTFSANDSNGNEYIDGNEKAGTF